MPGDRPDLDAFWSDVEARDLRKEPQPVTHVVTYRPEFVIAVRCAPGADPDEVLETLTREWNDLLTDQGEHWTEAFPENVVLVRLTNVGSTSGITEP